MPHNRPISPHLQIYKLPLTALISISHRLTGVFLSVGLIGLVYILWQITLGDEKFNDLQTALHSISVQILIIGFVYALMFHLCHGLRHLLWDAGQTFSREKLTYYALIELFISVSLTIFFVMEIM
ncbi:MAG: succinate dehydrogenase, cytochrome b556 subunit [Pseudomonadota bacterium]|jgi:succinate dehydrogenase / fumarate reductase cytochrome b subunit